MGANGRANENRWLIAAFSDGFRVSGGPGSYTEPPQLTSQKISIETAADLGDRPSGH